MTSSANICDSPSPDLSLQSIASSTDGDDYVKYDVPEVPSTPKVIHIVCDGEQPCCSKSLTLQHVRFSEVEEDIPCPPEENEPIKEPAAALNQGLNNNETSAANFGKEKDDSSTTNMVDSNNNPIFLSPQEKKLVECASFLFQKDKKAEVERIMSLMPRGREYVIFNVFGDLARALGLKRRKKHVAFPHEFTEKYEQQGDVAGKDRFVPASNGAYGNHIVSKKRKLSAIYSNWTVRSEEFSPQIDRVENLGKCEHCLDKMLHARCCHCGSPPPTSEVTKVVEGYFADLNAASIFLHGHATRTFESAMCNCEFVRYHQELTVTGQTPWNPNYDKNMLGQMGGSIWMFTYCIRTILQEVKQKGAEHNLTSIPSENNFRRILEQYATLCLMLEENVKTVLQYSHNFYNFCKECRRIIKVLQIRLGFRGEITLKKPLRRGDGLKLKKKLSVGEIKKLKGIEVMVARNTKRNSKDENDGGHSGNHSSKTDKDKDKGDEPQEEEEPAEWKRFLELTGTEKAVSLREVLHVTSEGMNRNQTQLRFLIDDIIDLTKDTMQADLLFVLADMNDRVKFLEGKNATEMLKKLSKDMTEFCSDFQSFVNYGQHIMMRFVAFRDMVHLCYEFLVNGLNLELMSEMVPNSTYKGRRRIARFCPGFCSGKRRLKRVVNFYQPKYKPWDFFRVFFEELVTNNAEVHTSRFTLRFERSDQTIQAIMPSGSGDNWGDAEMISPRLSFEEYANVEDEDEDGDKDKVELKPILVGVVATSPRHSIDSTEGANGEQPDKGSVGGSSGTKQNG